MLLLSGIAGEDANLLGAISIFLGLSIINGILVPNYLEGQNKAYLRIVVSVSNCAPNSDPSTIAMLVCMGAISGIML